MTDVATDTDVLVVGAGPTGLTLAIELRRRGVDCRLLERDDRSVETSRALAIQPRTLQTFEDAGVLEAVLGEGMRVGGATVYDGGRELFRLDLDNLRPPSPYPYLWFLPQNRTERILVERLEALGGEVEFEREVAGFEQHDETVVATVEHRDAGGARETVTARWLVGCDGAHSRVRDALGLELRGVTTPQEVLVADADVDWDLPTAEASVWFHEDGVVAALPMPGERRWRLFVDVTPTPEAERPDATVEVLQRLLRERTDRGDVTVERAPWTSNFVTNQRIVDRYREGHVFLAGDSAHVHNPLGGQGMNLGIGDAYDLGWKLALVLGGAPEPLLDTYEEERRPVAETVLDETGVSGSLLVTANPAVRLLRDRVLPRVLASRRVQARILRATTRLDDEYRGGSLADVHLGSPLARLTDVPAWRTAVRRARRTWRAPRAGDRAPDGRCRRPDGTETSLYREIHGPTGFALLLFTGRGGDTDRLLDIARRVPEDLVDPYLVVPAGVPVPDVPGNVAVLVDDGERLHEVYGVTTPSLYLLRPDDHVGFRGSPARAEPLLAYLDRWFGSPVPDYGSDSLEPQRTLGEHVPGELDPSAPRGS